mmetsp:Transcript_40561/g.115619  ORF Transcript_40561/g.115619 Transcript_40561/m.115619 type:complete len:216 (+) Transcript_40561:3344-3991(+)
MGPQVSSDGVEPHTASHLEKGPVDRDGRGEADDGAAEPVGGRIGEAVNQENGEGPHVIPQAQGNQGSLHKVVEELPEERGLRWQEGSCGACHPPAVPTDDLHRYGQGQIKGVQQPPGEEELHRQVHLHVRPRVDLHPRQVIHRPLHTQDYLGVCGRLKVPVPVAEGHMRLRDRHGGSLRPVEVELCVVCAVCEVDGEELGCRWEEAVDDAPVGDG